MKYEVSQVIGEGEEEDEEELKKERSPEEDLLISLENYRSSDIAQLHLNIHSIIQEQKNTIKVTEIHIPNLSKIDEYLIKIKNLMKRKKNLENRCNSVKSRFQKVKNILDFSKE